MSYASAEARNSEIEIRSNFKGRLPAYFGFRAIILPRPTFLKAEASRQSVSPRSTSWSNSAPIHRDHRVPASAARGKIAVAFRKAALIIFAPLRLRVILESLQDAKPRINLSSGLDS
jgi:hypothetical protein